jgi:hypothetical protein
MRVATFIVRLLDRRGQFCGVVRDVRAGTTDQFVDADELVALLAARHEQSGRAVDTVDLPRRSIDDEPRGRYGRG